MGEHTESGLAAAQRVASIPPSETLDPAAFYSLYQGGLSFPDQKQRLRASAVLMLGGRLGLRPGEIQHLHEEWIDWGRGVLTVPERDPCACQQCWETARHAQRAGDGRNLQAILTESTWSPPGEGRAVPFGWSQRLTAILGTLCEEESYLDLSAEAMARLIERSAYQAEGLDPSGIDFRSLSATSAAFFADTGFGSRRIATLLGESVETAHAFAQRASGDARQQLAEQFGGSTADPGNSYTLVANPEPFEREPFDPWKYDAEWRQGRAYRRSTQPEAVRNPRPVSSSVGSQIDGSDLGTRSYLNPNSDLVDETNAATRLEQWVNRQESARRVTEPKSSPPPTGQPRASAAAADSTPSQGSEPSPPPQPEGGTTRGRSSQQPSSPGEPSEPTSATGDGASRSEAGSAESSGESRTAGGSEESESAPALDEAVLDPRDRLSGEPIHTATTTVACSDIADGQPTTMRVLLGPRELLLIPRSDSMGGDHAVIELDTVVDMALDHVPSQLDDTFEQTVTVAYDEGDGRRLAVLALSGNRRTNVSNTIYKLILSEAAAVVTHPAKRGGRVLSTDPAEAELTVDDRSVSIVIPDEDAEDSEDTEEFAVRLSDVTYIELEKQTYEDQRLRSLSVRHLDSEEEAIQTTITVRDDRKHKLFQRFIRRSYRKRKQQVDEMTLTDEYKEVLVALYSAGDQFDISMIIDKDPSDLQDVLNSLGNAGLVRKGDNGAVLTGLGRVVVNQKIEDVNT